MSNLFLPGSNGKYERHGDAHFSVRAKSKPVPGQPLGFDLDAGGDFNAIMSMLYESMEHYPDVAKIMLTVFYKFCRDKGILPADIINHTFFAGSGSGLL